MNRRWGAMIALSMVIAGSVTVFLLWDEFSAIANEPYPSLSARSIGLLFGLPAVLVLTFRICMNIPGDRQEQERERLRALILREVPKQSKVEAIREIKQQWDSAKKMPDLTAEELERLRENAFRRALHALREDQEAEERADGRRLSELHLDYYAHALTVSKLNERSARWLSDLGVLLLLTGAGLSIWRANHSSAITASVVQTIAGTVITAVSQVLGRRATEALRHLEAQTEALRQDSTKRQEMDRALRVLLTIEKPDVRDTLRELIVAKLAGIEATATSRRMTLAASTTNCSDQAAHASPQAPVVMPEVPADCIP
jgi:hypothetical protein